MPRAETNAPVSVLVPLIQAAAGTGYASESIRKFWFDLPEDERPPLIKRRGRWMADPVALAAWAEARSWS